MSLQSFYFPNLFYISNMQECWSHFLLSHNHVINPLQIICESCFLESKLPICTASKCGQKLYCYEFVCFGNTDVRWVVQYLFLVEIMIGVVADGGHGLLVCFSGLLFLPNLPAPAKVPKREIDNTKNCYFYDISVSMSCTAEWLWLCKSSTR